jgi:hypothetical protein
MIARLVRLVHGDFSASPGCGTTYWIVSSAGLLRYANRA